MTWFLVDDKFHLHPKVTALHERGCLERGITMWLMCGTWCAANLTDGRISLATIRRIIPFRSAPVIAVLLEVGLWKEVDSGYAFVDWEQYQPTKRQVLERREKTRKRVNDWRNRNAVTNALPEQPVTPLVTPLVTLPHTIPIKEEAVNSSNARTRAEAAPEPQPHRPRGYAEMERSFAPRSDATAEAISRIRQEMGGAPFRPQTHTDREMVRAIADYCAPEPDPIRATEECVRGYLVKRGVSAPLRWLAEDPGQYRPATTPTKPQATTRGATRARLEAEQARLSPGSERFAQIERELEALR